MSTEEDFDWGTELSEEEWRLLAAQVKASELHLRFAVALDRGCTAVEAAAQAGYSGTRDIIKGSGHRAKSSRSVQAILALAAQRKTELAIGDVPAPDREARRRMLGKLTKSKDPRVQQSAIDALNKMDVEDRAVRLSEKETPTPNEVLHQIAAASPLLAAFLAHESGINGPPIDFDSRAMRKWHCASCAEKIIENLKADKAGTASKDDPFYGANFFYSGKVSEVEA